MRDPDKVHIAVCSEHLYHLIEHLIDDLERMRAFFDIQLYPEEFFGFQGPEPSCDIADQNQLHDSYMLAREKGVSVGRCGCGCED